MPFIKRILAKEVSLKEIAEYHYKLYSGGSKAKCGGGTPFCAYPKRNAKKILDLFN
jgi:hypothetical protein